MRALAQNWLRSALTMTGIVIGVLSIVTLIAIMQGVNVEITQQVEGLGANLVIIVPGKLDENGQPNPMAMIGVSSLTDRDVEALRHVKGVEEISPVVFLSGTVELPRLNKKQTPRTASAFVVATNRAGVTMNPTPLAAGRYFTEAEETQNVCVLGNSPYQQLFGSAPAVGKSVRVQDKDFKVVGVMAKAKNDGTLGGALLGLSNFVYIPREAARRAIPGGQINRIVLKIAYPRDDKQATAAFIGTLEKTLRASHGNRDDFGILTEERGLALVSKLLNMAQALLGLIAAISLFVAGVGIMNIMLVTVTERTREIGIRKTVGARRADIFLQFLTEAVLLSLLGGLLGLGLSELICSLIARYSPLTPQITPLLIGAALAVCTFVGVLFGVTPAVRAAGMNPIDALRHE